MYKRLVSLTSFLVLSLGCFSALSCGTHVGSLINLVHAGGLTSPTVQREQLFGIEDAAVLHPQVIERSNDGALILAGGGNSRTAEKVLVGGAAKYDINGKELWRYVSNLHGDAAATHGLGPKFFGVAPMRDGSIYLCGSKPDVFPTNLSVPWAMLTHLDTRGQLLSEKLVAPSQESNKNLFLAGQYFHSCVTWGDYVAIIGTAERILHLIGRGPPPSHEDFYWILVLDAKGKIKWEKLIPFSEQLVPFPNGSAMSFGVGNMVLLPMGQDLVFSATDALNSEVIRLSSSGEIKARTTYVGDYRLIRPVVSDRLIQLWGKSRNPDKSTLITLDENLKEVSRLEDNSTVSTFPPVVYRMQDQSFMLFGVIHSRYLGLAHVDRSLGTAREIEPFSRASQFKASGFKASGEPVAIAPTGNAGEFVTASDVLVRNSSSSLAGSQATPSPFHRGTVLDFVKLR